MIEMKPKIYFRVTAKFSTQKRQMEKVFFLIDTSAKKEEFSIDFSVHDICSVKYIHYKLINCIYIHMIQ